MIKKIVILLIISYAPITFAQEDHQYIKPLAIATDINSVDLVSGKYYPQLPTISIPAAPRLSFHTIQKFVSKIDGTWSAGGNIRRENHSVTFGGNTSEFFECSDEDCIPARNTGSTLFGTLLPVQCYRTYNNLFFFNPESHGLSSDKCSEPFESLRLLILRLMKLATESLRLSQF